MSESTAVATIEAPKLKKQKLKPPNHRKALIGLRLLKEPGCSLATAITESGGYSAQTARCPQQKGLSVEACISEAQKLYGESSLATVLQTALATTELRLAQCVESEESLRKTNLGQLARLIEVAHRWADGTKDRSTLKASEFVDKVEWLNGVIAEIKAREASTVDVDPLPVSDEPASDNR